MSSNKSRSRIILDKNQIEQFKEAFSLFDQDGDGEITVNDLQKVYESLGRTVSETELKSMVEEVKDDKITLTSMLKLFGEKLTGTDEDSLILNSFKLFDKKGSGKLTKDMLRDILVNQGKEDERLTESEFENIFNDSVLQDGCLDYSSFIEFLKHGGQN